MHILCRTRIQFCVSYIDYWMLAWVQLTLEGKRDDCSIANDEGQVCLDIFGFFQAHSSCYDKALRTHSRKSEFS